jgi:hypothetical protein
MLQDCYNRLTTALRNAGSNAPRPGGPQQPAQPIMQASQSQNEMALQQVKANYPHIDFKNLPRDWIVNFPPPRFQESLKKWILEQQSMAVNPNVANQTMQPQQVAHPGQLNRNPTPVSDPNMAGPSNPMANRPGSEPLEIQKLHETFKQRWRSTLQTISKKAFYFLD